MNPALSKHIISINDLSREELELVHKPRQNEGQSNRSC